MNVLITGGAGFLGVAVAKAMVEKGYSPIIYDKVNLTINVSGINCINGDIFERSDLTRLINKSDIVIHMVGLASVEKANKNPQYSFELNVHSLQYVLEAMRETGIQRLILPSAAAVYGTAKALPIREQRLPKPVNTYGYHKYIAEQMTEIYSINYGIKASVLRIFNPYGCGGHGLINMLLEKAQKDQLVRLYGLNQIRDLIDVKDVAEVIVRLSEIDHEFEVINIGTGIGRSIAEILEIVKEYYPLLRIEQFNSSLPLYDSVACISKLKRMLDFSPDGSRKKIADFIEKHRCSIN